VVDLSGATHIMAEDMASRSGWTPFEGRTLKGRVVGTIIRGRRVMWEGEIVGPARGEPVRFTSSVG
jgi:dihydroorotase